jgi:hypothetical protein
MPGPFVRLAGSLATLALIIAAPAAQRVEHVLHPVFALPAHVVNRFDQPAAFVVTSAGDYLVLDRRAHAVFRTDAAGSAVTPVIGIGQEPGRLLRPTAIALSDDDILAVLDAPGSYQRLQYFTPAGTLIGLFYLTILGTPGLVVDDQVVSGSGVMAFDGATFWFTAPSMGTLMFQIDNAGTVLRRVGHLRATGHEANQDLHAALNAGVPVVDPTGGMFFVFQTGRPMFRKYDAEGHLRFERHVEGPELDTIIQRLPDRWTTPDDGSRPLPAPVVRTAAADRRGRLWVVLQTGHVYVYDGSGEKIRTIVFGGPAPGLTSSLYFTRGGRVLTGPGGYEFDATLAPTAGR